jgi:4-amino-4-deoxy-L-arabinose transferase-like glycosyltransferase
MKYKLWVPAVMLALLLFHGYNNYLISVKSRYCLECSDSWFYFECIKITFQILKETKFALGSILRIYDGIFREGFRSPLFSITASPFLLFGIDKNNAVLSNLVYLAVLLFSTYGIGKKLYGYKAGLLSALLVSIFPTVFALSRVIMLDFALTAMVALVFYLFLLNKFDNLVFSLLVGLAIGAGTFIKQSFFIFIIPALVYFFLQKDNLRSFRVIRNFFISCSLAFCVAALYYARISLLGQYEFAIVCFSQVKNNLSPYFYLQSIFNRQLMPVFSLLSLVALVASLSRKEYFLPLTVIGFLAFFSLSSNKQDRFILPLFPFIAVMMAGFMFSLPKARKTCITILLLFSFLQYFTISYKGYFSVVRDQLSGFFSNLQGERKTEVGLFFAVDEGRDHCD